MPDPQNQYAEDLVFYVADEPVVADPVFPELTKFRTLERYAEVARIIGFCNPFVQDFENAPGGRWI